MSDDRPTPLEVIVRAVTGGDRDDGDERASTFARGLALGALVGAAIAGSTIWQRRQARSGHPSATNAPSRDTAASDAPSLDAAVAGHQAATGTGTRSQGS